MKIREPMLMMLACAFACAGPGDDFPIDSSTSASSETESSTDDTDEAQTTSGQEGHTSESSSETTGAPCETSEDCDVGSPFCEAGECRSCSDMPEPDAACAELDPNMPACVDAACEQCDADSTWACPESLPNCDVETHTCTGCADHDDCPDSACNLDAGTCFASSLVAHVDGDDAADFHTINDALDFYPDDVVIILHELSSGFYEESASITGGRRVAIVAAPDEQPRWRAGQTDEPTVRVGGASWAFLRGLRLESNWYDIGLEVSAAEVWLQRSRVVDNALGNVFVGGVGSLRVENSFIGGVKADSYGLHVVNGSVDVVYSTLATSSTPALSCVQGSSVRARNSIIVSGIPTSEIHCPWADLDDNAIEMHWGPNVALGDMSPAWFESFTSGDYHLQNGAYPIAIATAAVWRSGDPSTDIDGDPRPSGDGSPDFAGADVP